jgi:hypothetical protein
VLLPGTSRVGFHSMMCSLQNIELFKLNAPWSHLRIYWLAAAHPSLYYLGTLRGVNEKLLWLSINN